MFDNKYPYTDFHELNLDWFMSEFKKLVAEWEETKGEWNTLHDYVQNYFENLNVQTEINNKINAMILDGTFADIVSPFVTVALPALVAGQLPDVVAAQISSIVAAQISAVVADQLPAVAATAAAQEVGTWLAAHIDPDTGYVIDDTLTVSQAAADAKTVGDLFTSLKLIDDANVTDVSLTWLSDGTWYDNTGNYRATGGSSMWAAYSVTPGDFYHFDGFLSGNSAYIVYLDSSDNVINYVWASGSSTTPVNMTFKIPTGVTKIVLQQYKSKIDVHLYKINKLGAYITAEAVIYQNATLKSILDNITSYTYTDVSLTFTSLAGFYNTNGSYQSTSGFTGATVNINGNDIIALSGQVATNMATLAYYDSNDNYMGVLNSGETGPYYTDHIFIIPSGASKILIQRYGSTFTFTLKKVIGFQNSANADIASVNSELTAIENGKADVLDVLTAFSNITCVGDSLTWGQVYTGSTTSRKAYVTYPQALAKISGTETATLAGSGMDASEWWDYFNADIILKENQLAIVYLGTNAGFTDTLATDAPEDADPSTWADTNTGCLAKIVNKFQTVGAKVCMVKCYATNGNLATTNSVIEQVAGRFNCGIVDNSDLGAMYHLWPNLGGSNPVHYNDLGYSAFARMLNNKISRMDKDILKYLIP